MGAWQQLGLSAPSAFSCFISRELCSSKLRAFLWDMVQNMESSGFWVDFGWLFDNLKELNQVLI